jgi:hypothetical protein
MHLPFDSWWKSSTHRSLSPTGFSPSSCVVDAVSSAGAFFSSILGVAVDDIMKKVFKERVEIENRLEALKKF